MLFCTVLSGVKQWGLHSHSALRGYFTWMRNRVLKGVPSHMTRTSESPPQTIAIVLLERVRRICLILNVTSKQMEWNHSNFRVQTLKQGDHLLLYGETFSHQGKLNVWSFSMRCKSGGLNGARRLMNGVRTAVHTGSQHSLCVSPLFLYFGLR